MNLGQLVRQKMKELKDDKSGEYIDKMGRHFELSAEGDGYTVKYGGGKTLAVASEQACKLTAHCRKLESAERKELAGSLNTDHWIKRIGEIKTYALGLTDARMIEAQIARLDGLVAGLLIGDYKNDPGIKSVADAKTKAIDEIKRGKNYRNV